MLNVYEQVDSNKRKSVLVMVLFTLFIVGAAWVFGKASGYGLSFVGWALVISGIMSWGSYYYSDKIILTLSRARPADRKRDFQFYTVTENLAMAAHLPKPKLYVIEDTAPNAFATGRDPKHAVICVTTGLLSKLDRTELEGVMAHEISHIRNYDIRLMSVVSILVGTVALMADWFFRMRWYGGGDRDRDKGQLGAILMLLGIIFAILSPIIARLIQLAISRRREFMADAGSVSITRQPTGLISALNKISADHEPLEAANKATAHLYIVNPFKDKVRSGARWFSGLFNTHPPLEERIVVLSKMV